MPTAYVLINCNLGHDTQIMKDIKKIHGVSEVQLVFGAYDCVVRTEDLPQDEIKKIISSGIRRINNVRSTLTLNVTGKENDFQN